MRFFGLMILLGLWLGINACSEGDFEGYSADSFIYFDKEAVDSTIFSFAYDKSLNEGEVALKVKIISNLEDRKRTFQVRFLPTESTAKEGMHFEKPAEGQFIAAMDSIGYLKLKVMRGDLKNNSVKAVFELTDTEDFKVGMKAYAKTRIIISDELNQPAWWDAWHVSNGLGRYTRTKYEAFIEEMHMHDLTMEKDGGTLSYSEVRAYVLEFKRILEKKPRPDEDGSPMTVAMRG